MPLRSGILDMAVHMARHGILGAACTAMASSFRGCLYSSVEEATPARTRGKGRLELRHT